MSRDIARLRADLNKTGLSKSTLTAIRDTYYDLPAEHWRHLRTTNPIESSFVTRRHRTDKSRAAVSRETIVLLALKLALAAQRGWRRLNGFELLTKRVAGVRLRDGIRMRDDDAAQTSSVAA
jgi:transposase-like protein